MQALDNYIGGVKTLPPAPRVLSQLLILLNREDTDAREIVRLIAFDPALTAKVLQRCNVVALSPGHAISDLDEAVARVGFNAVYRLVAMVIGESLLGAPQQGYGIRRGELWEHSVATALAAKVVARRLGGDENLAFTAALLHDVGKLVLSMFLEDAQQFLLKETGPSGQSFLEAEKTILGVDHAEIGGRLLEQWNFPENLVYAVRHHHDPIQARPFEQLAAYVHLGDIIAHCLGHAQGFQSFAVRCQPEALQILKIGAREMDVFVLEADIALEELNGLTPQAS